MFDMSWGEVLVIGAVALVVIGPKDLPKALRTLGNMTAGVRKMAGEFQSQFNEAMREAELDEIKKQVSGLNDEVSSIGNEVSSLTPPSTRSPAPRRRFPVPPRPPPKRVARQRRVAGPGTAAGRAGLRPRRSRPPARASARRERRLGATSAAAESKA